MLAHTVDNVHLSSASEPSALRKTRASRKKLERTKSAGSRRSLKLVEGGGDASYAVPIWLLNEVHAACVRRCVSVSGAVGAYCHGPRDWRSRGRGTAPANASSLRAHSACPLSLPAFTRCLLACLPHSSISFSSSVSPEKSRVGRK